MDVGLEQFRDAEIEQLDVAVDADEHVRGLEIAVHDQVGMRVRDGREDFEKQAKAGVDIQPVLVAVAIDPLAFDVLEDEIRLSRRRHARVDEVGDVRMAEAGEDVAFAPESLLARPAHERHVQQLDRGSSFEAAVAALGQPHAAHAALADA